jgi:hypothetical protein
MVSSKADIHSKEKNQRRFQLDPTLALQANGDAKLAQIYN